jgi:hypothetical protein
MDIVLKYIGNVLCIYSTAGKAYDGFGYGTVMMTAVSLLQRWQGIIFEIFFV